MLNFLVDYKDPTGVDWHTSFQANAGRQHRRLVAVEICRNLKAGGCTPQLVTCIPGDYSFAELEDMCQNGLPHNFSPLHGTYEYVDADNPSNSK